MLASASAATTELVVRVDDRLSRSLTQPYIVAGSNDTFVYVQALDDGTDEKDRYSGDRLFVGRLEVPAGIELEVRVTDVLPQADPIEVRTLVLPENAEKELTIKLAAPEDPEQAGPQPRPPTPDVASADRVRATRLSPKMGAWPSGAAGALGGGAFLIGVLGVSSRRLGQRIEGELTALAELLRSLRQ